VRSLALVVSPSLIVASSPSFPVVYLAIPPQLFVFCLPWDRGKGPSGFGTLGTSPLPVFRPSSLVRLSLPPSFVSRVSSDHSFQKTRYSQTPISDESGPGPPPEILYNCPLQLPPPLRTGSTETGLLEALPLFPPICSETPTPGLPLSLDRFPNLGCLRKSEEAFGPDLARSFFRKDDPLVSVDSRSPTVTRGQFFDPPLVPTHSTISPPTSSELSNTLVLLFLDPVWSGAYRSVAPLYTTLDGA